MKIIIKDGTEMKMVYRSHDRWLDDLSHFIKNEFVFSVNTYSMSDLLDRVSAHLNHWLNSDVTVPLSGEMTTKIKSNPILNKFIEIDSLLNPELIIYEYDGRSIYDEIERDKINYNSEDEILRISLRDDAIFYMSREEFEDAGGEIELPLDEDDDIDFYYSIGEVFFFMTNEGEKQLQNDLLKAIQELNKIYTSLNLKLIDKK